MKKLTVAVQKGERMCEPALSLFEKAGLKIERAERQLVMEADGVEIALVRGTDIPSFLRTGICDAALMGSDVYEESMLWGEAEAVPLGIGGARISMAAPASAGPLVERSRVATSYPNILNGFLIGKGLCWENPRDCSDRRVLVETIVMSGAVEGAVRLGIADAICDIVSSGGTLGANGLVETERVMDTEGVFVIPKLGREKRARAMDLLSAIQTARSAK
jgi:ATP phosphoribosyltransferase